MVTERPTPTLADDMVLIRTEASVIGVPERAPRPEITPGGAAVGEVVEAGAGAAELRGRRVVIGPDVACGECDVCRRAVTSSCPHGEVLGRTIDGTLASAVAVRARWLCSLDQGLEIPGPEAALLGREAAWAYSMLVRAGVGPGDPVFVLGDDVVARFLVELAIAKGTRPLVVMASERPAWRDWVHERGGVPVVVAELGPDQSRAVVAEAARAAGHGERPRTVFACAASDACRGLALDLVTAGSRVVTLARRAVGLTEPGAALALDALADADATLIGVAGAHPDLLPELAALAVRGEIDLAGAAEPLSIAALPVHVDQVNAFRAELPRAAVVLLDAGA